MYQLEYNGSTIEYNLSLTNVHIRDSYKITDKKQMKDILGAIRSKATEMGYQYRRTNGSWLREWIAHNFLYERNYECARTGSVDLSEQETKFRLFCYIILSKIYRGKGTKKE